jgi:hypothetical protein
MMHMFHPTRWLTPSTAVNVWLQAKLLLLLLPHVSPAVSAAAAGSAARSVARTAAASAPAAASAVAAAAAFSSFGLSPIWLRVTPAV